MRIDDICGLHGERLVEGVAPIVFGLVHLSDRYLTAVEREFPNSCKVVYGGCLVGQDSPKTRWVKYCPRCRQAEESWCEDPLDRFQDAAKRDVLRARDEARRLLAMEMERALERLFPLALECARADKAVNLLVQAHGIRDDAHSTKRIDILLEVILQELGGSIEASLPEWTRTHYAEIYQPGWEQ